VTHLSVSPHTSGGHATAEQLFLLMSRQVSSYHKQRHMGSNTSIPVELAHELMESVEYTLNQAGEAILNQNLEHTFHLGQGILEQKLRNARSLLTLVCDTGPCWQTDCRWDAIGYLRQYVDHYDHLHLAHKGPDDLFYPVLISPPEGIQGIDCCLFFLNILLTENLIISAFPQDSLGMFWDKLPYAALNPCEHLLINSIGKLLIGSGLSMLTFTPAEYLRLVPAMRELTAEKLDDTAAYLCRQLSLVNELEIRYVRAIIPQLLMWAEAGISLENISNIFI
jgi:hypothetical protein